MSAPRKGANAFHRGIKAAQGRWMKLPQQERADLIGYLEGEAQGHDRTANEEQASEEARGIARGWARANRAAVAALKAIGGAR